MDTKIATCCYCGKRTMLKLTARGGHELACGSCGAPIHEMKALKQERPHKVKHAPYGQGPDRPRRERRKRRKPTWKRALGEVADLLDDIFD
ncbi:hypothetical protein HKCCE2091_09440 [Rhodobacterales bacterium HKCCE2091]|nr:hypothetical protein [Rhodobacterales bacterium HKCCE2091]